MPETRERKSRIRVAVLLRNRLGAEALSSALHGDGFEVVLATSDWNTLATSPLPVDIAVIDQNVGDGVMLSTRIRDLSDRGTGTVVIGPATADSQKEAMLHAGALAFVGHTESFSDLAHSVMTVATEPRTNRQGESMAPATPLLGRREERALVLYASGRTMREVADEMETTEETVKSYIKRARRKYRDAGINVGTRMRLRGHATTHGWLD